MNNIKHVLRECKDCKLVYGNGWFNCPLCGGETIHYATAYSEDVNHE